MTLFMHFSQLPIRTVGPVGSFTLPHLATSARKGEVSGQRGTGYTELKAGWIHE